MNEQLKKECMDICEKYEIDIDFDDKDWKNEFTKKIHWGVISMNQILSEFFIEKFQKEVNWDCISKYQKLSEFFIEKFQNRINWSELSYFQKLSEDFIEKFQDKLNWRYILYSQILSESFIEKYIDKFDKNMIDRFQRVSKDFAKKHNIEISEDNWYQKSYRWKLKFIKENTKYKILNDENGKYILAHKAIRSDNKSFHDPDNYQYIVGQTYESKCNCNLTEGNSFGLAAWDINNAIEFGSDREFKLILVKIYINDIGAIIKNNNNKIRCFKFEVIEEVTK